MQKATQSRRGYDVAGQKKKQSTKYSTLVAMLRKVIRSLVMNIENFWLFDRKFSVGLQFVILLCAFRRKLAQKTACVFANNDYNNY